VDSPKTFFVIEASHLFRAGDKFQTQFFVIDVVRYLQHEFFPNGDVQAIVLHGSVKDEQANRYAQALERTGVKCVRMEAVQSKVGVGKVFYKPSWYIHGMLGAEIPKGSNVVFVGFHNERYLTMIQKYTSDFNLSLAAFTTPSRKNGMMGIPVSFQPYLKLSINLDHSVEAIKSLFRGAKRKTSLDLKSAI
jgi:hypothetical protein